MVQRAPRLRVGLTSRAFVEDKTRYYRWMLREAPVCRSRLLMMDVYLVAPYAACTSVLTDERVVRNRTTATGKGRLPFPAPHAVQALSSSMIVEDDPEHRRLRTLVAKAFTPRSLASLESGVRALSHRLLDAAIAQGAVDLTSAYSLPIPVTVIRGMLGVPAETMAGFRRAMGVLTRKYTALTLLRAFFVDMRRALRVVDELVAYKRQHPGDDILTGLIEAEQDGDRLSHDELRSMIVLLIGAGYETTVHLISNGVHALLTHPDELDALRADPSLMPSAVEEILRFAGPVHGTKPNYALEELDVAGTRVPAGAMIMPLLGAANLDPAVFDEPERFDIRRSPNKHLAFGHGRHHCLGAALARMECRVALQALLERCPGLRLAVPEDELQLQRMPLWHRYARMPVVLR